MISFVTLGIMWANHHTIFTYIRRTDRYFLLIHVFFLMCISFLPFPTAVLAEHLPYPDSRRIAVAAYSDEAHVEENRRLYRENYLEVWCRRIQSSTWFWAVTTCSRVIWRARPRSRASLSRSPCRNATADQK